MDAFLVLNGEAVIACVAVASACCVLRAGGWPAAAQAFARSSRQPGAAGAATCGIVREPVKGPVACVLGFVSYCLLLEGILNVRGCKEVSQDRRNFYMDFNIEQVEKLGKEFQPQN